MLFVEELREKFKSAFSLELQYFFLRVKQMMPRSEKAVPLL